MAHSRQFYSARLDHRASHLDRRCGAAPSRPSPPPLHPRLSRLQHELAQFETRCDETRHALDSRASEADAMKQHVALLQAQLLQSDQVIAGVKGQLWGLEEELAQLQADQVALQLQLELESANHARDEEEWLLEKEELRAHVARLENELHLAACSDDGELDFLMTPANKGPLSSPGTLNGLSLQTLLDMGEASLEVEEDIHELKMRLQESERTAANELAAKDRELQDLQLQISRLKDEVAAEKDKAKEEAEDLTQEMAELRYQLMEMIEQERELRAQTEQASVLRVVELESQVKSARQEVVQALASRRAAEMQSDRLGLEVQRVRLALENADQELKELKGEIRRAQAEVEQGRKDIRLVTDAKLKLDNQLKELEASRELLNTENQELRARLEGAFASTSRLEESLRDKEAALHALVIKQSEGLTNGDEAQNNHEDFLVEQSKKMEDSSHEHLQIREDARGERVESHEGSVVAPDSAEFRLCTQTDGEVPGTTGACALEASKEDSDNHEISEVDRDFPDAIIKDSGVKSKASDGVVEMGMQDQDELIAGQVF